MEKENENQFSGKVNQEKIEEKSSNFMSDIPIIGMKLLQNISNNGDFTSPSTENCIRINHEEERILPFTNVGAGILCYSIPPDSREIYFLLGKDTRECKANYYNNQQNSNFLSKKCWRDFGGRMELGESEEKTAAREFYEESLGLVCSDCCLDLLTKSFHADTTKSLGSTFAHDIEDISAIEQCLLDNKFSLKIRMCLNHGAQHGIPRRYYVTYVKQIPWNPSLPKDFFSLKQKLQKLYNSALNLMDIIENFLLIKEDKTITRFIKIENEKKSKFPNSKYPIQGSVILGSVLKNFILSSNPFYIPQNNNNSSIFDIGEFYSTTSSNEEEIKIGQFHCTDDDKFLVSDYQNDTNGNKETFVIRVCNISESESAQDGDKTFIRIQAKGVFKHFAQSWHNHNILYESLPENVKSHPAIYKNNFGIYAVYPQYLETDSLQYWSQGRLEEMLKNGGVYKRDCFRSSFIPTIAVVIKIFQNQQQIIYENYNFI